MVKSSFDFIMTQKMAMLQNTVTLPQIIVFSKCYGAYHQGEI